MEDYNAVMQYATFEPLDIYSFHTKEQKGLHIVIAPRGDNSIMENGKMNSFVLYKY